MKKNIFKSMLDGIVQTVALIAIIIFINSPIAGNLKIHHFLIISVVVALMISIFNLVSLIKETNNILIVKYSLNSALFNFVSIIIVFCVYMMIPVSVFPIRAINNVNGISIMLTVGCFAITSIIVRLFIFLLLIIRNKYKKG